MSRTRLRAWLWAQERPVGKGRCKSQTGAWTCSSSPWPLLEAYCPCSPSPWRIRSSERLHHVQHHGDTAQFDASPRRRCAGKRRASAPEPRLLHPVRSSPGQVPARRHARGHGTGPSPGPRRHGRRAGQVLPGDGQGPCPPGRALGLGRCQHLRVHQHRKGRLRASAQPHNTTLETVWEVQETNEGRLVLVEDVVIQCSRFWVSFVKSTGESGWPDFHGKMMRELQRGSCHGG